MPHTTTTTRLPWQQPPREAALPTFVSHVVRCILPEQSGSWSTAAIYSCTSVILLFLNVVVLVPVQFFDLLRVRFRFQFSAVSFFTRWEQDSRLKSFPLISFVFIFICFSVPKKTNCWDWRGTCPLICHYNSRLCELRIVYLIEDGWGPQWRPESEEIFIFRNILRPSGRFLRWFFHKNYLGWRGQNIPLKNFVRCTIWKSRTVSYDPRAFFKKIFLILYAAYVYPFWVVSLWPRKVFASVGPVRMSEGTE